MVRLACFRRVPAAHMQDAPCKSGRAGCSGPRPAARRTLKCLPPRVAKALQSSDALLFTKSSLATTSPCAAPQALGADAWVAAVFAAQHKDGAAPRPSVRALAHIQG